MCDCPLDYSLCDQTVTVYRKQADTVFRLVAQNCAFQRQETRSREMTGQQHERSFLLVMPGDTQRVFPGDRVLPGIGPQISIGDWPRFIPSLVEGLVQVGRVTPCYWNGRLCHVEAKEAV